MIAVKDLTFRYENSDRDALRNINLEIPDGEFLGVIGTSGAGKTTLMQALNGIIPHHFKGDYFGSVTVDGKDTFEVSLTDLSRYVGTVLQDIDSQMVSIVVEDEILYGLENFNIPRGEAERRLNGALEEAGISDLRNRSISTLSGGQKQKVAIASVMALRPKILILDEPTGELDPFASRQIFSALKKFNEQYGMTVVIVEQKIMLLSEFAKKLAVMNDGRLEFYGPVRDVLEHSEELENMGVNCPRVVTLSNAMKYYGISDGEICVNVDEAEKMVRRAFE